MTIAPSTKRHRRDRARRDHRPRQGLARPARRHQCLVPRAADPGRSSIPVVVSMGNLAMLRSGGASRGQDLGPISLFGVTGRSSGRIYVMVETMQVGEVEVQQFAGVFRRCAAVRTVRSRRRPALLLGMDAFKMFGGSRSISQSRVRPSTADARGQSIMHDDVPRRGQLQELSMRTLARFAMRRARLAGDPGRGAAVPRKMRSCRRPRAIRSRRCRRRTRSGFGCSRTLA